MTVARSPPIHCLKLYRHIVNQTRKNRIYNAMWIKIQQYNNLFSNAWFGGLHKNTICCQDRTKIKHNAGLTHWGRVTHKCVSKLTIIGSDNGLSPGQRQAIIWTSGGMLFIRTLGKSLTKFIHFHSRKSIWICDLRNGVYFVPASMIKTIINHIFVISLFQMPHWFQDR